MSHKVVLINDPGIDGAFAIALAVADPALDVLGILATPGNVPADRATKNVRIILDQLDPPRWPRLGAAPPIQYAIHGARLHGPNGLGNTDFPCASLHHLPTAEKLLIELAKNHPHELTVICMGPLTVIARALDLYPELPSMLKRIIILGGSLQAPGNAGPVSEFHFACDPPAARQVLRSYSAITLVPLDMMRQLLYAPTELLGGESELSPAFPFLRQILPFGIAATSNLYGIEGFHLKDVLGIVAVARPELVQTEAMHVDVETQGELTTGMSVFDRRSWQRTNTNVDVLTELDLPEIRAHIRGVIGY